MDRRAPGVRQARRGGRSRAPRPAILVTVGDEALWYDDRIFRLEDLVSSGEGRGCPEPSSTGDDSDLTLRLLEAERFTVLHGVPMMFHLLMRDATFNPTRLRTLRSGITAGGSVSEDMKGVDFLTGDPGIIDENGYVRIVGRSRETILRGGFEIYPREVEGQLRAHPAVHDVCVIGVPHDFVGELVCACIVPVDGAAITGEAVKNFARDTVADYKVPDLVRFVDALPRPESGNVKRRELERMVALDHTVLIGST